jgi:hypothetical protein
MASDRQQFAAALAKWRELGDESELSVPVWLGRTAVVTSSFTDEEPGTEAGASELASFRIEAVALADRLRAKGHTPEVAIDATRHDITRLIADASVVSVYVIGNGSLSTLLLGVRDSYDWSEVAAATTHRKLGVFVQRQCGGMTRSLNVPLGLFAVDDPTRVFAAIGDEAFNPCGLDDPENDKIRNVLADRTLHYEAFKRSSLERRLGRTDALGRAAATVSPDERHRGNFFGRFIEMRAVLDGDASDEQIHYVRMVKERFGFDLVNFYAQHRGLCDAILGAGDPRGVEAVGAVSGEADGQLLERAYRLMEQATINAPFLTR